jgi:hypothetical protein
VDMRLLLLIAAVAAMIAVALAGAAIDVARGRRPLLLARAA